MDNHAISLAFDSLNKAYEAEMERDEKKQQQELAALLQQEFDDFDYDDDEEDEDDEQDNQDIQREMENRLSKQYVDSPSSESEEDDGDDEEEEEEDEDEEEEEDEDDEERRDEVNSRLSIGSSIPPVSDTCLRPRDWSTPLPPSLNHDAEMQPRECTPAASQPPDPPHTVFPPGPPSTDTSEVFGPRIHHSTNPTNFLAARLSQLSSQASKTNKSTRDVGVEAIPVGQRELDQLEILYQARGRRIEELQSEVLRLKEEQARELRVIKHRLSLAEGERNGARLSHQEAQRQLVSAKEDLERSKSELRTQQQAMEELTKERAELSERLRNTEMTVEAMNGQLVEMNTTEALRRAKEQQNNVMASLKLKYDREVVELRETVDLTRRDLEAREDALRETRARADLLEREKRELSADHAEAVSRMVRELDELQTRLRDSMNSASADEMKKLKTEVDELTARKNITDSVNRALQDEAKELKEQLSMYENAQRLGLGTTMVTSSPGFHREGSLDTSTHSLPAQPRSPSQNMPSPVGVSTTASLKRELERCLVNYRAKRQQASELQEQLFDVKKERQELKSKLEKAESQNREQHQRLISLQMEIEDLRVKCSGENPEAVQLRRDFERVKREKECAEEEKKVAQMRMEEVLASEGKLSELNKELQRQISQIFRDFDSDKRESLDRLQQTWEQHLEQSKTTLREELTKEFGSERIRLVSECEARVNALESRLKSTTEELDRVKNEFVALAELRSKDMEEAKEQFEKTEEERRERMLADAKEEWKRTEEVDRENFLTEMRQEWEKAENQQRENLLNEARDTWKREEESRRKEREEEHQRAILESTKAAELRVKTMMEAELKDRLTKSEENWKQDKDTEVQSRLNLLRDELEGERDRKLEESRRQLKEEFDTRTTDSEREWQKKLDEVRLKCDAAERLRNTLSTELVKVRADKQSELNSASSIERQRWTDLEAELRRKMERIEGERDRAKQDGENAQREREIVELELRRRVDTLEAALAEARQPVSPVVNGERQRSATLEAALAEECRRSRDNLQRQQSMAEETEAALRRRVEELEAEKRSVNWEDRVREMKRKLEKEFRARFNEYRSKRDTELADLQYRLDRERLIRVTKWQDNRHFGCQTDSASSEDLSRDSEAATISRMREQFVESLSRIRGEVLAHVSMSRTRAALAMQTELGRSQHRACRRLAENIRSAVVSLESRTSEHDSVSRAEVLQSLNLCLTLSRSAVNSSSSSSDLNTPRSCSFLFPSDRTSDQSILSGVSLPQTSIYEPLKAFRRVSGMSKSVEEKENWQPFFDTRKST